VDEPKLGEFRPSVVKAEIVFSLHHFSGEMKKEWEMLKPRDVVFLMTMIDPDAKKQKNKQEQNDNITFGTKYGLFFLFFFSLFLTA
jgi:hypothetical protein